MKITHFTASLLAVTFLTALPVWAQDQPAPQPQYPPPASQYPQQQPYPQQQGQYPPQQGQYPQAQYPQQPYPQQGQYPPQGPGYDPYGAPDQAPQPAPVAPAQLDQLVGPIALYPDGLLAQVLTASTFFTQIPQAASWAQQHSYLHGDELARAIQEDQLPFDPSIQGLLPFPQVLDYMARNPGWTQALGNAVLVQRPEVMDAVQRMRQQAYSYGYLQSNQYERVDIQGPVIQILPYSPGLYYVPFYDPYVVYARPRAGFFVGGAIRFGGGISIGAAFAPWGWGSVGFGWSNHAIFVGGHPWERGWVNRRAYVGPYSYGRPHYERPYVERHDIHREEHRR